MKKSKIFIMAVIILLVTLGSIANAAPAVGVTVGKTMPEFTLQALNGGNTTVAPANKAIIINFWATWCPPCLAEMPELNAFAGQYGETVTFYAVNLREEAGFVNEFMYKNSYSMPVLLDSAGEISNLFQVKFIPTTIIVDSNGSIVFRKSGPVTKIELEKVVNNL